MDPKEKQKILILFGIFGMAALVLYYSLLFKPQLAKFIVLNREYFSVSRRIKDTEKMIAERERIKKDYGNTVEKADSLEKRFLRQEEVANLLQDFSEVANYSGVRILKIKPLERDDSKEKKDLKSTLVKDQSVKEKLYYEFPILIEAQSTYHQCGDFVNRLERLERFINIKDVIIRDNPDDVYHHSIKLRVIAYVLKE